MRQQQQQQPPPPPPKPQEQRTMVVVAIMMMMCGSIFVSSCWLLSMVPVSIGVVTAVDVAASASTTTGTGSRRLLRNTNNSNNQGQELRQQQRGNDGSSSSSNSRYNNILQERVLNPTISDDLRGKTWKDLGIIRSSSTTKPNDNTVIDIAGTTTTSSILEASSPAFTSAAANLPQYQERRRTQEKVKLEYFAVRTLYYHYIRLIQLIIPTFFLHFLFFVFGSIFILTFILIMIGFACRSMTNLDRCFRIWVIQQDSVAMYIICKHVMMV